jgi:quinol monooxygenase YgiN
MLFTSDSTLLQCPPVVHNLEAVASFTRASIFQHHDPYIVFGTLDYKPGTAQQGILGFTHVCAMTERDEPGTLSYSILRDKDNANRVKTLEVYESERYLWDSRAKSAAVNSNKEANKDIRANLHLVFLKLVTGYFYKYPEI